MPYKHNNKNNDEPFLTVDSDAESNSDKYEKKSLSRKPICVL